MTPITQVIYARPEETIGTCRSIMGKLGVKCLPILSNGRVEGLITSRDMSEYGIDAAERGGKKHYLESVSERVGLSSNTSMAEPPAYIRAHLALRQNPLYMNVGVAELPHPFKTGASCGINRRDYGPDDVTMDVDLSEDAHFVTRVQLPDETGQRMVDAMYLGIADGVGSWREYGVDPKKFSHQLMQECENIVKEASFKTGKKVKKGDEKFQRYLSPAELMAQAYERVKADNIIGSSTACVAMFDGIRHQLHFSNLGDSGIIVLRHIDSNIAGTLKRDKTKPRLERKSDLRVAFVSQQQLRSFNHPYQLGWTGEELNSDEDTSFKNASQSCSSSIHIRRGDILILATDGLFDNVELEDISKIALDWEEKNGFIRDGDIAARDKRWASGSSMTNQSAYAAKDLAQALVQKARENSLDSSIDSPFAILAKENDVMWSGGMPDDCTVIVMHIVGAPSNENVY
jgi:protein phosphatase PTC7